MRGILIFLLGIAGYATAEMPVPALPQVYVDTRWNPPVGGNTWRAHTPQEFQHALDASSPGDTITLDAGATYEGNFTVPAKSNPNHKWIYIESSELATLPRPGKRMHPESDAAKMPKIVTGNESAAIRIAAGATNYRLVGLELYSKSTQGCGPRRAPPVNCSTYSLIDMPVAESKPLPDAITVDRCFLHGSDTQDVRVGVVANGTNIAVVDSYISDIHQSTSDSQAILAYWTPGPIKVVDNFLSSTSENLMCGGAGGARNPYVPSDIEIRNNHFFKPEKWAVAGLTLPPEARWSVKNSLEFKSARRVVVTGNVFENNWVGAQWGFAIVLTVRTSDSGNFAVVDDITIENNLLKNVTSGFSSLEHDDNCTLLKAPFCNNSGEAKRWKIANNLILLRNAGAPGGQRPLAFGILPELTDVVIQHNTVVAGAGTECWASVYFSVEGASKLPLARSSTHNLWITDNVLCRPPTGDWGGQGTSGLMSYMGDPPPLEKRFTGNLIYAPGNSVPPSFPSGNLITPLPLRFADPKTGDYQLRSPEWTRTTDGKPAGVDVRVLNTAISGVTGATSSEHR